MSKQLSPDARNQALLKFFGLKCSKCGGSGKIEFTWTDRHRGPRHGRGNCDPCGGHGYSLSEATRECGECRGSGTTQAGTDAKWTGEGRPSIISYPCPTCHGTGTGNWPWWRDAEVPARLHGQDVTKKQPCFPNLATDAEACLLLAHRLELVPVFMRDGTVEFDRGAEGEALWALHPTFNAAVEAALMEAVK